MSSSPLLAQRPRFIANLNELFWSASPGAFSEGHTWYPRARAIIAEWADTYQQHPSLIACVIAALSPQTSWERNLVLADDLLAERPLSIKGLASNERKARLILKNHIPFPTVLGCMHHYFPTGRKVQCFAQNLAGDDSVVTVDTHCFQAAFKDPLLRQSFHPSAYDVIAGCYQEACALSTPLTTFMPATFQAIIWCEWKNRYPRLYKRSLRQQW